MQSSILFSISILTFGFLFSSCASSQIIVDANKGMNGGFESIQDHLPVNWYFYKQEEMKRRSKGDVHTDFVCHVDSTDVQEGKYALVFNVNQCSNIGGNYSPGFFNEFEAEPGATYEVRFWVKNDGTDFRVTLDAVREKGGKPHEVVVIKEHQTKHDWKEYTALRVIPIDMHLLRFEVSLLSPGTFKMDHITINKLEK